jgi:hypothetical protein
MTDVSFTPQGLPDTVLPAPDPDLEAAVESGDTARIEAAVTAHPSDPLSWAALGDLARGSGAPVLTAYAYYRVGYHRGLDLLRKNGWKGSGHVRSTHPSNLGFLRCLAGLADMAAAIGEEGEAERCREFLEMLDPGEGGG